MSEWLKEADCKSAAFTLRGFESLSSNHTTTVFGLESGRSLGAIGSIPTQGKWRAGGNNRQRFGHRG